MPIPSPIRLALRAIVHELQNSHITWAVTGSCSLALQAVPVDVHDLDLRTTAQDAYVLAEVFAPYVTRPVTFMRTEIAQSHFGAFDLNGVQVEIIGDMQHRLPDGSWEALVNMNDHKCWVTLDEIKVPVMSLPFLYQAYQLMGRQDKIVILKRWFEQQT